MQIECGYKKKFRYRRARVLRPLLSSIFLSVLLLLSSHGQSWPAASPVSVQGTARQGGVLFVSMDDAILKATSHDTPLARGASNLRLTWLGQRYPLVAEGRLLRAVLPIPVDTTPGGHTLRIEADEGIQDARVIQVRKVGFPHRSIHLPAAMLATYDSPRAKRDDALLLAAARRFIPERHWHGSFSRPAAGPFSTRFGVRRTYNGWRKGWHRGLDIEAEAGTAIHAPNGGIVAIVAPHSLVNGNATLINHGLGVASLYLHQSRIRVSSGQRVAADQIIGNVGSTGAGTGPHLHWACYVHGVPIDPRALMHVPPGW